MNYYILPKNTHPIKINYTFSNKTNPFISHSLIYFLDILYKQIDDMKMTDQIDAIKKYVNTYEFVFSTIGDSSISIGKQKVISNIYYELIEIFSVCNISDELFIKSEINTMHISENADSSAILLFLLRGNKKNFNLCSNFNISALLNDTMFPLKIDFFFFELNKSQYSNSDIYFKNAIVMLYVILKNQCIHGTSILKIGGIFYKPIIDILYILTSAFDKVYVIKPTVSNIFSNERYIVCKNFTNPKPEILTKLAELIYSYSSISSIIENPLPYYFMNKVEESNIVIGNQALEALDQVIVIVKNKNKDEKMESLKKHNIQKCIQWCEKYKVPYNKLMDKINVFLTIATKEIEAIG